ncbi:hypothetical protein PoB_001196900 [Plakobranchus ocellatus]|uniref:Uncharacterized protein n=1 Tax=Plakobranchus ocellatus TaxID=259542 RepID=A0AAV3YU61_9GAST|nr:hypothetical protein PoB_001196900 [Plakobranchus ocellatus]
MGGTTLNPKHNVGKRTPTECVDHGRFTGSRRRWSSEASSYANHFDRHSNIDSDTYINPGFLNIASPQQGDLVTSDRRVPAYPRADSQATVPPKPSPLFSIQTD